MPPEVLGLTDTEKAPKKLVRVIAGKYRSRPLRSLRGLDVRPTADRLRETLFDVLAAGNPDALQNSVWLDLFAGTGAVGIEALSRGSSTVYFVESSPAAANLILRNLGSLQIENGFEILRQDTLRALRQLQTRNVAADFIFLDPPYRMEEIYGHTLKALAASTLLKPGTIVIAEHDRRFDPGDAVSNLGRFRRLEQSDAALSFYKQR